MHLQFLIYDTIIVLKLLTFYYYRDRIGVVMVNYTFNIYERGFGIMSKNNGLSKKAKKIIKKILYAISCGILGIVGVILGIYIEFRIYSDKINKLDEVPITLSSIETKLNDHISYSDKIEESFENDLNGFRNSQNKQNVYIPTSSIQKDLSATEIKSDIIFLSSLKIKGTDTIGENPNTKKPCKAKNLKDKKILLPYTENGKEVYFYGQYNKKYHWDGHCILNIYDNNKLSIIMDGWYKDGELISYNRVTCDSKTQKINNHEKTIKIWRISKRVHKNNVNTGETFTYFRTSNKKKKFTLKDVEPKNIISTMDFENLLDTPLEGYYKGNTSDGKYNDETGEAYLIKYFEDGTTRMIYCGNFKNGEFNDHTGKAWYVAIDEGAKKYIYFKGGFTNGKPDETEDHKRKDIKNEDIHKIIDKIKFNSVINLRGDNYNTV